MFKIHRILFVLLVLGLPSIAFAASLKLKWLPNSEPDLSHYSVYCGTSSRVYSNPIPVGKTTSYTVEGLQDGQKYYCALTGTDTSGNESGFSSEISAYPTVSQPSSVSLTASISSPQNEGVLVRFTASASGGSGSYEYRFWEKGPHTSENYIIAQDFSPTNHFDWNTSGKPGETSIVVWCRSAGTNPDSSDIKYKGQKFTVAAKTTASPSQPNSVSLSTSLSSPQSEGELVRFTATASGGSGNYEYRFWEKGPNTNGHYVMVQDFSSNNTFNWNTFGKAGETSIVVWCRSAGTNPDSSAIKYSGQKYLIRQY